MDGSDLDYFIWYLISCSLRKLPTNQMRSNLLKCNWWTWVCLFWQRSSMVNKHYQVLFQVWAYKIGILLYRSCLWSFNNHRYMQQTNQFLTLTNDMVDHWSARYIKSLSIWHIYQRNKSRKFCSLKLVLLLLFLWIRSFEQVLSIKIIQWNWF